MCSVGRCWSVSEFGKFCEMVPVFGKAASPLIGEFWIMFLLKVLELVSLALKRLLELVSLSMVSPIILSFSDTLNAQHR